MERLNLKLKEEGSSYTIDLGTLFSEPTDFIESIEGLNSHVILERSYSYSKDGKNWNSYCEFHYNWFKQIPINCEVRVRYSLIKNIIGKDVIINEIILLQQGKDKSFEQGESFLLSSVKEHVDFSGMSESMQKLEIDMNYYINHSSALEATYWHTNPDKDSIDTFLNEYSLHNVVKKSKIKYIAKDNKIPEPRHEFSQWGIEFEKLEIYFEKSYFEEIFGINEIPRENDYMYFKEINRMYYISDSYLDHGINENGTFWICQIKKYEDKSNVSKDDDDLQFLKDNLNIDDYTEDDINEMIDMTNEVQTLEKDAIYDNVKFYTNKNLIYNKDLLYNNGNDISNVYYDMSFTNRSIPAVIYNNKAKISEDGGLTIMFWIKLSDVRSEIDIIKFEDEEFESIVLSYDGNGFLLKNTKTEIIEKIMINVPLNNWICCSIGINNQFSYWSCNIMSFNKPELKTTSLLQLDHKEKKFSSPFKDESILTKFNMQESKISLLSGNYCIRNIRIGNYYIDPTHYSYIMGCKIVKKPSLFFVIDDCDQNINTYKVSKSLFPHLDKNFTEKGDTTNINQ